VVAAPSATWGAQATSNGLGTSAGLYGSSASWDFLAYAAGDVDNQLTADQPDTWLISSADGELTAVCPTSGSPVRTAAGEPITVFTDVSCNRALGLATAPR
jgi:hypothetical protein